MSLVISHRFQLRSEDWKRAFHNSLIFLLPLLAIYIAFVTNNIRTDGFAWSDFIPDLIVIGSLILYVLNVMMDLIKKFLTQNIYK